MPIVEQILVIDLIVVSIAIYYHRFHHFALNIPLVPKFHGVHNHNLFIAKKDNINLYRNRQINLSNSHHIYLI